MANHQKAISPARRDRFAEGGGRIVLHVRGDPFAVFRLTPAGGA